MAHGRLKGCPVNIKDWIIEAREIGASTYTVVNGLLNLSKGVASSTEDGSGATDTWEEPYITKRSGSWSFSGRKMITPTTGATDPGQALLEAYAELAGCDADLEFKVTDAYGNAVEFIGIVESFDTDAETSTEISIEVSQVGQAEPVAYVQLSAVSLKDGVTDLSGTLSIAEGAAAKVITVVFDPETASNKKFRISNTARSIATVSNVTDSTFTITPIAAGTATIKVTTVNGPKDVTLVVTVTGS